MNTSTDAVVVKELKARLAFYKTLMRLMTGSKGGRLIGYLLALLLLLLLI